MSYRDADTGEEQLTADDEAYPKGATTTQTQGVANPPAYLHEAVFGWDGESLGVPAPAATSPRRRLARDRRRRRAVPERPASPSGRVDGQGHPAAPALRRRLPGADADGGPLRHVDHVTNDDHATTPRTFRRFQPIAHPTVVQRHAVTVGESTLRLVVRSGVACDPTDASATLVPVDPAT